jgi:hypothetical protein
MKCFLGSLLDDMILHSSDKLKNVYQRIKQCLAILPVYGSRLMTLVPLDVTMTNTIPNNKISLMNSKITSMRHNTVSNL